MVRMILDECLEKSGVTFAPVVGPTLVQPRTAAAMTYKKSVRVAQQGAAKGMQKNTMAPVAPGQNKV
jgi:hypothetical protein